MNAYTNKGWGGSQSNGFIFNSIWSGLRFNNFLLLFARAVIIAQEQIEIDGLKGGFEEDDWADFFSKWQISAWLVSWRIIKSISKNDISYKAWGPALWQKNLERKKKKKKSVFKWQSQICVFRIWCGRTGMKPWTQTHSTFWINWNADYEPGLILQHPLMLLWLTGIKSMKPDSQFQWTAFQDKWRLLLAGLFRMVKYHMWSECLHVHLLLPWSIEYRQWSHANTDILYQRLPSL